MSRISNGVRFRDLIRGIACGIRDSRAANLGRGVVVRSGSGAGTPTTRVISRGKGCLGGCSLPLNTRIMGSRKSVIGTNRILIGVPHTMDGTNSVANNLPHMARLFRTHGPSGPTIISRVSNRINFNGVGHNGHRVAIASGLNRMGGCVIPLSGRLLIRRGSCVHTNVPLSSNTAAPSSVLTVVKPATIRRCVMGRVRSMCHLRNMGVGSGRFRMVIHRVVHGIRVVSPKSAHFLRRRIISGLRMVSRGSHV